jgi:hypothetical protein
MHFSCLSGVGEKGEEREKRAGLFISKMCCKCGFRASGALVDKKDSKKIPLINLKKKSTPNQAISYSKFDLQLWVSLRSKHS